MERSRARSRLGWTAGVATLGCLMASAALAQPASVTEVTAERAVIDAAGLGELQPGAKIGFRRSDQEPFLLGEGFVLDVRDGMGIVGLRPGATVQVGDQAFVCATLVGQAELRASVDAVKVQLPPREGGDTEADGVVAQLDAALDAREAAIRDGACDVADHDGQLGALSLHLQQVLAAAVPPPAAAEGSPVVEGTPVVEGGTEAAEGMAPPIGAPGVSGTEAITTALQVMQQLLQMAQSSGLVGGEREGSGQQQFDVAPSPEPFQPPPFGGTTGDPGSTEGTFPPVAEAPPSPAPGSGGGTTPPPAVERPPVSRPPVIVGAPVTTIAPGTVRVPVTPSRPPAPAADAQPPAGHRDPQPTQPQPPAQPTPPPQVSRPPTQPFPPPTIARPPVQPAPPLVVRPPVQPPPVARPPVQPPPPVVRPVQPPPVVRPPVQPTPPVVPPQIARPPGQPPPVATPPATARLPAPGASAPPTLQRPATAVQPAPGTVARVPPGAVRLARVRGIVRGDDGKPLAGALVNVAGKRARTDARGVFTIADVPLGRQTLVATAGGFLADQMPVNVAAGGVDDVAVTLRRKR